MLYGRGGIYLGLSEVFEQIMTAVVAKVNRAINKPLIVCFS